MTQVHDPAISGSPPPTISHLTPTTRHLNRPVPVDVHLRTPPALASCPRLPPTPPTSTDTARRVAEEKAAARNGSADATAQQHRKGKKTARERMDLLFDPGTFVELDTFRRHRSNHPQLAGHRPATDGVITGWGQVYGRDVFAYAQDFRIFGGSLGEEHANKVHKLMDLALTSKKPLVSLSDGAGARIQEGAASLAGYGGIFRRNVAASGVIPQISVILGPCAGGAAYSPSLTDFLFMVDNTAQMFITGPAVLEAVTGEQVSHNELGGAHVHASRSGVASDYYDTEEDCLDDVRYLLSLLPENSLTPASPVSCTDRADRPTPELLDIVPAATKSSYNVTDVVAALVDDGEYFEVHPRWAKNLFCGLVRLGGRLVGVVANQPNVKAGVLDIDASAKGARFVQMCDGFNIPLLTLVDVPGFMPGVDQEHNGIIRHGAKLLYAYCNATVPRISLILRKAYGGAYIVMDSRSVGADLAFAWPTNEVAVMGAEGAVNVIFGKEIAKSDNPDACRDQRMASYAEEFLSPLYAAELGLIDEVVDPRETRQVLIRGFDVLAHKHVAPVDRKHGNPPQ